MEQVIQCLSAFLGCLGFAFVFRVHRHLPYALLASLGGMLGWIVYLLVIPYLSNIMSNLCAMIVVALFSEIMARICKAPATIFIVVGCFPIVPGKGIYQIKHCLINSFPRDNGKGIYQTMLYLISHDQDLFLDSLFQTVGTALALATAILIVSTFFKVIKTIKQKDYHL